MAAWTAPERPWTRGYYKLYYDTVLQAEKGADLDFWSASHPARSRRESH